MNFGDVISAVIGGGFGIVFLGSLAVYVVACTTRFCMPIFKDVYREYANWKLERAKEDQEFVEIYKIYKRMNREDINKDAASSERS